jgi:hypothetical protein
MSRVKCHVVVEKIAVKIHDINKIEDITADVQRMLCLDEKILINKGLPWCCLSAVFSDYVQLTIGYKIPNMVSPDRPVIFSN